MILGAIYNIFEGVELLEKNISNIRSLVDYILVVYQKKSNYNLPIKKEDLEKIYHLHEDKLIDYIIEFIPNFTLDSKTNETEKRNMGLEFCKILRCNYCLFLDVDEFYISEQFKFAKEYIENNNLSVSFCKLLTYLKNTHTILYYPKLDWGVPFITKIEQDSQFVRSKNINSYSYNILGLGIDSSRKILPVDKYYIFKEKELLMHHLSWVRKDIKHKLVNNPNYCANIDITLSNFNNCIYGEIFMEGKLINITDLFGISYD